jgi:GA-binding protein alpha chain
MRFLTWIVIREPLQNLKLILEQKLGADLSDYDFWLQVL